MYIINPEKIANKIKFKGQLAKYFTENGVPLLSKEGEFSYFAKSETFQKTVSDAPIWVRWAIKLQSQ